MQRAESTTSKPLQTPRPPYGYVALRGECRLQAKPGAMRSDTMDEPPAMVDQEFEEYAFE